VSTADDVIISRLDARRVAQLLLGFSMVLWRSGPVALRLGNAVQVPECGLLANQWREKPE
jgi:hypothetical protein